MIRTWIKSGTPWIWLNAGAVSICMILVLGLILLIAVRGLSHFWPAAVLETMYAGPGEEPVRLLGSLRRSETVTAATVREAGFEVPEEQTLVRRHLLQLGNRDLTGRDFAWFIEDHMGGMGVSDGCSGRRTYHMGQLLRLSAKRAGERRDYCGGRSGLG